MMRSRRAVSAPIFCLAVLLPHAAHAERERVLENRVIYLEERVAELEALLKPKGRKVASRLPTVPPPAASPTKISSAAASAPAPLAAHLSEDVSPARQAAQPPSEPVQGIPAKLPSEQGRAPNPADKVTSDSASPQQITATDRKENAPQELNVLRQNSVTLDPRGIEVSTDLEYSNRHTDFQRDRGLLSNTSLRYGVLRWLELSATIPVGFTTRTTNIGIQQQASKTVSGLGDVLLQANARIVDQTEDWPGIVFSLGTFLPTGKSPYDFSRYSLDAPGVAATPNPNDIFAYHFSRGGWALRTNLQFYRTVDPFILFAGVGTDYFFPQQLHGFRVSTGLRYGYNAGFSFAASEKTTLGFTLNGQYFQGIKVNGRSVYNSAGEPTVTRLTIIQRVAKNTYIEPAISFGLNRDAPDFALGLGLRKRF